MLKASVLPGALAAKLAALRAPVKVMVLASAVSAKITLPDALTDLAKVTPAWLSVMVKLVALTGPAKVTRPWLSVMVTDPDAVVPRSPNEVVAPLLVTIKPPARLAMEPMASGAPEPDSIRRE